MIFDDAAPVARKGMWRQVISSMFCMIDASGARIASLAADLRYMPWANATTRCPFDMRYFEVWYTQRSVVGVRFAVREAGVDGRARAMYLKTDLGKNVRNSQILTTYAWTRPTDRTGTRAEPARRGRACRTEAPDAPPHASL